MAWRASAALLSALVLGGGAAVAESPAAMTGPWVVARTSEWPHDCSLTLLKAETIGGQAVKLKPACAALAPWTADIAAWRMAAENELVLQDATRHGLVHFTRGEDQDWVGPGPDGQDYVIARPRPIRRPAGARP